MSFDSFEELQIVAYVTVSFLTLLVYDWLISLIREINCVWHSRWSVVKVLYLYTRYAPFIVMAIAAQERISSNCNEMTFTTILAGATIGISDLILMLRTYSIFNKSRTVLAIICVSWTVISVVCVLASIRATNAIPIQKITGQSSCLVSESNVEIICFSALLGGECVITLLTFWKTLDIYRKFHFRQVVYVVYCEGLFYYFMILPITIANLAVFILAPPGLVSILDSPLTVMHSVLCCKLVLHVREVFKLNSSRVEDEDELLPIFIIVQPYMLKPLQQYYM
ncbi:hypothetical protein GGU11DRAFT_797532 [Lentinula aff. detonsa]|uniref:DUF6533 domain-containing protein n=1 Tax=Lentinula aff. detonsa TaxID=2804958 RepID=A0AA38NPN5_9AGAR|nr:hypothetical protein GGU10DRAFT_353529 [Lentinula aff. detonsa]KAJ3794072.1 hypothetical protein GGU11DRAFT_797532 [Lentinula aff. detonsa]